MRLLVSHVYSNTDSHSQLIIVTPACANLPPASSFHGHAPCFSLYQHILFYPAFDCFWHRWF